MATNVLTPATEQYGEPPYQYKAELTALNDAITIAVSRAPQTGGAGRGDDKVLIGVKGLMGADRVTISQGLTAEYAAADAFGFGVGMASPVIAGNMIQADTLIEIDAAMVWTRLAWTIKRAATDTLTIYAASNVGLSLTP